MSDPARSAPGLVLEPPPEGFGLSPQQRRLVRIAGAAAAGLAAQCAVRVAGAVDPAALSGALDAVAARWEILRTRLLRIGGVSLQRIDSTAPVPLRRIDLSRLDVGVRGSAVDEEWRRMLDDVPDLESAAVFEACLLALSERESLLILRGPAFCLDRLGLRAVVGEVAAALGGRLDPEPPLQYADVAGALLELLESPDTAEGRAFWAPWSAAPPHAPLWHERAAGAEIRPPRKLEAVLPGVLGDLAAIWGVPAETLIFVLWRAFLKRLGDGAAPDLAWVLPGRAFAGLEAAPGLFARALPAPTATVEVCLRNHASQVLVELRRASEHQDFFDATHAPRFGFEWVAPTPSWRASDFELSIERESWRAVPFALSIAVGPAADGGFQALLEADPDRFAAETFARIGERWERFAAAAAAYPEAPLRTLDPVGPAERSFLLEGLNGTLVDRPTKLRVDQLFRAAVRASPDRIAVIAEEAVLSLAALAAAVDRVATALREAGGGPGLKVAICIERSPEMVIAVLAAITAGAAYVPLDPDYPLERLRGMLADAAPTVLIAEPVWCARLAAGDGSPVPRSLSIGAALAARPTDAPTEVVGDLEDLAYVIYTSGSTGRPKGVMISHGAIINRLSWMARVAPLAASDRVLQKTPYSFDASVWEILSPLLEAASVVLVRPDGHREPAYLARVIVEQEVTILQMVPPQLSALLDEPEVASCGSLRRIYCGGDAFPAALRDRCFSLWPEAEVRNLYGPTEASIDVASWRCARGEGGVVPIGRPIDNTRLYLLDEALRPVPFGAAGELFLAGAGLARGYHARPDATAERFLPDPFDSNPGRRMYATGDLARYASDGAIEFLGRNDHQVKVRGIRIELGEVETALKSHPGVREAVVLAISDEPEGSERRLKAYVAAAGEPPSARQLRSHLRERLPEAALPAFFAILAELPQLPNGKLDRAALTEITTAVERADDAAAEALTPTEEILAGIWGEVLGVETVGREDDFFALGGHSLIAAKMASQVREIFHVGISLRRLFEAPTVAALAAAVDEARSVSTETPRISAVSRSAEPPLSFAQLRLWFVAQLDPANPAFNIANALAAHGPLSVPSLAAALREVVRRHEVLRTTFPTVDGEPRQRIAARLDLRLPEIDLTRLSEEARSAEGDRLGGAVVRHGFDLAAGPLLRAYLLRLDATEHRIFAILHHIVGDAWSSALLLREIADLYAEFSAGRPSPLPELDLQYADYAAWQREWLRGEALDAELAYWRRQLGGAPPVLEIPVDRARPAEPTLRGAALYLQLDRQLTVELEALARRSGATLFMLTFAAYQALLSYLTGREDVVVGTDIANRHRLETEGLIGFFINQLVLRTHLGGDPTFRGVLGRVREVALEAYAHQDLPFDRLIDLLDVPRDLRWAPIFQTKLFFQNVPAATFSVPGLELVPIPLDTGAAKLDLTLAFWQTPDGLRGWANYSTDLFEAATIERLLALLKFLLAEIAREPDVRLTELHCRLAVEERRLRAVEAEARRSSARHQFHQLRARSSAPRTLPGL